MHVLILPSWYFAAGTDDIGGRNFHVLARALRDENIDARILYAHFSPYTSLIKKTSFNIEAGVPTWRTSQWFPPRKLSFLLDRWIKKYVHEVFRYIKQEGTPDLIHAHSYMTAIVAGELKNKMNIPFVYTEHLSRFLDGRIPNMHKKLISKSAAGADLITCVSPGLASKLQAYTSGHIEVVPNFYDPAIFKHRSGTEKNKVFTWISIGEPSHTKGLDILIRAFGKFRQMLPQSQTQLIFIDLIKDKDALIKLAHSVGLDQNIQWTGLITHQKITEILQKSHALISSSRMETFGTVMVEANACGLPVIATKTDGATYIMNSTEQGLLVEINDVDALANAMKEMYQQYDTYLPVKIVAAVESRFRNDIVISKWIDLYNKIIA